MAEGSTSLWWQRPGYIHVELIRRLFCPAVCVSSKTLRPSLVGVWCTVDLTCQYTLAGLSLMFQMCSLLEVCEGFTACMLVTHFRHYVGTFVFALCFLCIKNVFCGNDSCQDFINPPTKLHKNIHHWLCHNHKKRAAAAATQGHVEGHNIWKPRHATERRITGSMIAFGM